MKKILLLDAYNASSHKYWHQSLIKHLPGYQWSKLLLPPRYFRWRIRGNPLSWLDNNLLNEQYDLVIATSMVDLASLIGMHKSLQNTPVILYFHENQFAYPKREQQTGNEAKVVNLYSALAADLVLFNSAYNRQTFIDGVESFIRKMPDHKPQGLGQRLLEKSQLCPVGIDAPQINRHIKQQEELKLLWNHRWEYDKGPEHLYHFLKVLKETDAAFRIDIIGEQFRSHPEIFTDIKKDFQDHIHHWGYIENRQDYLQVLTENDFVLSTSLHDFQGLSVLEAAAAGCLPVLPERLAYPEFFDQQFLYKSSPGNPQTEAQSMLQTLKSLSSKGTKPIDLSHLHWNTLANKYKMLINSFL